MEPDFSKPHTAQAANRFGHHPPLKTRQCRQTTASVFYMVRSAAWDYNEKIAGVAQWQSRSFPSLRRGFDSRPPLHLPSSSGSDWRRFLTNHTFSVWPDKRRGKRNGADILRKNLPFSGHCRIHTKPDKNAVKFRALSLARVAKLVDAPGLGPDAIAV